MTTGHSLPDGVASFVSSAITRTKAMARNARLRPSKFGRYPGDPPRIQAGAPTFSADRCQLAPGTDPARVICDYQAGRTTSARALAAKAAVLIDPMGRVGEIIWPPTDGRALMPRRASM